MTWGDGSTKLADNQFCTVTVTGDTALKARRLERNPKMGGTRYHPSGDPANMGVLFLGFYGDLIEINMGSNLMGI